jgi:hypothetical protein
MKLSTARLCVSCEEIHEEKNCPVCSSQYFILLITALGSICDRHTDEVEQPPSPGGLRSTVCGRF